MLKKLLILITTIALVISATIHPTLATNELNSNFNLFPKTTTYSNSVSRVDNHISALMNIHDDGTGLDVIILNFGIDGLDHVSVTVKSSSYAGSFAQSAYVPAIIGKTFTFNIPFIECDTEYKVTIIVSDGSEHHYIELLGYQTYDDELLAAAGWNKGTFPTIQASVDHHFDSHATDIGVQASNLVEYVEMAYLYRDEVLDAIANNTLGNYRITVGKGEIPSHNYKNYTDYRFILLTDSTYEILSFGGK